MSASERIQIIIDATGEGAKRALHQVGDAFDSGLGKKAMAAGKVVGVAMVAAGAAVAAFTIKAVADTTEYAESIDKAAKTTGMATDELQKLKYAADQEHTSFEALNGGLKFLAKNMEAGKTEQEAMAQAVQKATAEYGANSEQAKAAAGSIGTMTSRFKELGIDVVNADGSLKGVGDVLPQVADYFKNCTNDAEKTALAMQIFGRAGVDLVPFLEQGSAEIARLGEEAEDLGIIMSGDAISAFEAYGDQVDKMKKSFEGVKFTVAESLLPAFSDVTDGATDMFVSLREAGSLDQIFGTVGGVIADLPPTLETVFELVGSVLDALAPVLSNVLGRLGEIFEKMAGALIDSGMLDTIAELVDLLAMMFLDVLEAALPLVTAGFGLLAGALDILEPVLAVVAEIFGGFADVIGKIPGSLTLVIAGIIGLSVAFPGLVSVTGLATAAVLTFQRALDGIMAHPFMILLGGTILAVAGLAIAFGQNAAEVEKIKENMEKVESEWDQMSQAQRRATLDGIKMTADVIEALGWNSEAVAALRTEYDKLSGMLGSNLTVVEEWEKGYSDVMGNLATITEGDLNQMLVDFETYGGDMVKAGMDIPQSILDIWKSKSPESIAIMQATMRGAVGEIETAVGLTGDQANALAGKLSEIMLATGGDLTRISAETCTEIDKTLGLAQGTTANAMQTIAGSLGIDGTGIASNSFGDGGYKGELARQLELADKIAQYWYDHIRSTFSHPIYGSIVISKEGAGGVPEFHSGGQVLLAHEGLLISRRMRSDERLVLAENEEWMINRRMSRKYRDILPSINAGTYRPEGQGKTVSVTQNVYPRDDIDVDRALERLAWRIGG